MTEYASPIFQCVARQKCSNEHALIAKIEKVRKILNKGETFGALLTDLSKYHAPNFDMNALNLIFDYLTERKQRVKINSSFSSYMDIFRGVLQGSVIRPLHLGCYSSPRSASGYYSIYFPVIYSYFLRKLVLWVMQIVTLRICVLKMLVSH